MKNIFKRTVLMGVILAMTLTRHYDSAGAVITDENTLTIPTIRMGDSFPMTHDEFMEWASQKGVRHLNFEEGIYPAGIFFSWGVGKSLYYGEVVSGILRVIYNPNIYSPPRYAGVAGKPTDEPTGKTATRSEYHLTEIIDGVSNAYNNPVMRQNPLYARSQITLPNRRLTKCELADWIYEYNQMGGATAFELAVIEEINRVREYYGLNPLTLNPALMMSARHKTQEFGDLQYFGHTSPVHGRPWESARMFGYEGWGVAETITRAGSSGNVIFRTTPENIVNGMLASSRGHRDILLNPYATSVGFGASFSPYSTGARGNLSHVFYFASKFGFGE
ncbi:MAG: CAP domain-containing protein [Defluviitaleaceae bacterium]|nr:CAP domain-containing protein [Defluviitaleaceae bacterium]